MLSLSPFRRLVKDYFLMCESYYQAIKTQPPSRIEAIDMGNDEFADLLRGAPAIADYIGKSYRQTVYLLSSKQLPGYKIGALWYGRKSKIRARLLGEDVAASDNGGA